MFEFRIGRIPVRVHFSHFAFAAILAFLAVQGGGRTSNVWPYAQLATPGTSQYALTMAVVVLAWVLIVFVSALIHELGHAFVAASYGYSPAIELVWMGGHTLPNANETIPWQKQVLLTLAGPTFGLLLAAVAFGVLQLTPAGGPAQYLLLNLCLANLIWAVFNLIPVLPLDGGHVMLAVATRLFGKRGFLISQGVGFVFAALATALAVMTAQVIAAVLFAMWGMRTLTLINAYRRGQLDLDTARTHPTELALKQALAAYEAGKLPEAKRLGGLLLEADAAPKVRAQTHHLLGWIALKEGQGREALDHFSQIEGQPVEQKALAAAFSLIGDEARAIPLWERAWAEKPDPVVLHEWAGALIRGGREEEAARLPGVDLPRALECAERVAFIRGDHTLAAQLGERLLAAAPSARAAYDAACAWARAGRKEDAYRLLERAAELGYSDADFARTDEDLAALQRDLRFHEWAQRVEKRPR